MGIDCGTFWSMTPKAMSQYLVGYQRMKRMEAEQDAERMDYESWLAGSYVGNAIASCFDKRAKYPKRPHSYKEPEDTRTAADMAAEFRNFAKAFNANRQAR